MVLGVLDFHMLQGWGLGNFVSMGMAYGGQSYRILENLSQFVVSSGMELVERPGSRENG